MMAFMDWLRRLVTPAAKRPRPTRHRTMPAAPRQQPPHPQVTPPKPPQSELAVTPLPPSQTPTAQRATRATPNATLVIRLVDRSDHPLQPALVLTGNIGETVHLTFPTIAGYVLVEMRGMTQTFLSEYGLTTLIYQRQWGQPVTRYLIDYDSGQLLTLPQFYRGNLGAAFRLAAPTLQGYHLFRAQGPQHGTYTTHAQRLLYFYRRDAWQTVQRVHQYVTLTADHAVYDLPAGHAYGYQFPTGSLWRLFAIITLTDHSVWYNLGGNQWLNAVDTHRQDHWERHLELPHLTRLTPQTVHLAGTVDYVPHQTVMIYREPYGEIAGQLATGELLDIRRRIVDDQQLVWYQIGPAAYIRAQYVRLAASL